MATIITKVCSGYYDGTNDNVQLEFKNSFDETCTTDNNGNEFAFGQTDVWGGGQLMSCNGNRFRPIGDLSFRFLTNTWGWNLHHDQLRLCKVTAQFGRPGLAGYSVWQWNGDLYNAHYSGAYNSQSDWMNMRRIASTDPQTESETDPETETTCPRLRVLAYNIWGMPDVLTSQQVNKSTRSLPSTL